MSSPSSTTEVFGADRSSLLLASRNNFLVFPNFIIGLSDVGASQIVEQLSPLLCVSMSLSKFLLLREGCHSTFDLVSVTMFHIVMLGVSGSVSVSVSGSVDSLHRVHDFPFVPNVSSANAWHTALVLLVATLSTGNLNLLEAFRLL